MSDIDFDELDKAVNNLVSNSESEDNSRSYDSAVPITPSKSEPEESPPTPQKPKGKFMDVMHHSSFMTGKDTVPQEQSEKVVPKKVVSPMYNDIITPVKNNSTAPPPSPDNGVPKTNDWPDPIEVAPSSSDNSDNASPESIDKTPSPLFLPDTKVEKRPLGGFNNEQLPSDPQTSEVSKDKKEIENMVSASNIATPTVELPPELEADLVAIEEGGSVTSPEPVSKTKIAKTSGLLAAGSIPQQYKAADTATDTAETTHPIFFDADQYGKTPAPGLSKKKSSKTSIFQWVFIVAGLLLLGATLGAALFVFVSTS